MKLLELDFIAFGPFTDVPLGMTAGAQGVACGVRAQ